MAKPSVRFSAADLQNISDDDMAELFRALLDVWNERFGMDYTIACLTIATHAICRDALLNSAGEQHSMIEILLGDIGKA